MPPSADGRIGNGDARTPAAIVLEELARRRLSRQQLAERARISLSTLEKALSGRRPFTLATIVRLEEALGVSLRAGAGAVPARNTDAAGQELASEDLGSYARAAVSWIEGAYLTIRPSFGEPGAIYAYRTEILWDSRSSSLVFRETERIDAEFAQHGVVSVPNLTGHLYLVTNRQGQYRLIVVARPSISGQMHGMLTTLQAGRGAQLMPVSTPIALIPLRGLSEAHFGRIGSAHAAFAGYRALLQRTVEEPFAVAIGWAGAKGP